MHRPKPKIDAEPPRDINDGSDLIGRMQLLFDLIPLALQTDSTRLITIFLQGANSVPPVTGVTIDHHNLSHHGQEPEKIAQLRLVETAQMRVLDGLLSKLKAGREKGAPLLDDTMVLFGSNLGNANSHDTRNLPILLAGGGFELGGHTAYNADKNTRLCNLFVSMLQQLGVETDSFGSSTGTLTGLGAACQPRPGSEQAQPDCIHDSALEGGRGRFDEVSPLREVPPCLLTGGGHGNSFGGMEFGVASKWGFVAWGAFWWAVAMGSMRAETPADGARPTFRKVVLETDCDNPMELAVLPDGRVLFIERFGKVRVWKPESGESVLAAELAVHGGFNPSTKGDEDRGSWESGLIGLTLAPEFEQTGWVYLYYSPAGDVPENRVSRFTLRGDLLDLDSEKVVLRVPVQREVCCHEAGSLAFDRAGNLFLSTGDNTNPFESGGYNPTDYRDGRYPFDAARSAGNANDLRGKILRIHPEPDGTYTIPDGNLFPAGTPGSRPEIFVMGCRNPFRIAVDPGTGLLSWGDVGPDARQIDPARDRRASTR